MMPFQAIAQLTDRVAARPDGLWTLVVEFVSGPALLRVTASADRWQYADAAAAVCGADGDPDALLARAKCLLPAAPVGALIGKIGGSTAGAADGTLFVAGSTCVVRVPDEGGPLFLTINDEYMKNNAGSIGVAVALRAPP